MTRTIIAVAGIVLFLVGLILGISLILDALRAASLDEANTIHAAISDDAPPFCTWEASLSTKVMTQNTSQALLVQVSNPADKECQSTLALRAPGFEISPMRDEQRVALTAGGAGSLSWIVTPLRTGTFQIAVSDILNTQILGVTVKDEYGLTTTQAKLLALIASLFGPMLTVPWWVDRLKLGKLRSKGEAQQTRPQT
jgi:exosome complex RNA-binding protein Csl4